MINNFLKIGNQDVYFFPAQKSITNFLTVLVVIFVPSMLCVKPCVWGYCKKQDEHEPGHGEFEQVQGQDNGIEPDGPRGIIDDVK